MNRPKIKIWIIWVSKGPNQNSGARSNDSRPSSNKIRRTRPIKGRIKESELVIRLLLRGFRPKQDLSKRKIWLVKIRKMGLIYRRFLKVDLRSFRSWKVKTCTGVRITPNKWNMMPSFRSVWTRPSCTEDKEQTSARAPEPIVALRTKISLSIIQLCILTWSWDKGIKPWLQNLLV